MHIVILGCGRVGSLLARDLDELGHSVAVVDMEAKSFRRLPADFSGLTVTGIGFDRETLETAGIERARAFAAVSSGDNTNILAARVARETYGVDRVVEGLTARAARCRIDRLRHSIVLQSTYTGR